jgi:hypothetical protein
MRLLIVLLGLCTLLQASAANSQTPDGTCFPVRWSPPTASNSLGVEALLKPFSVTTTWAEVPEETKQKLQTIADNRLAVFRARWGAGALAKKSRILLECPTDDMIAAVDNYYRKTYDEIVPPTFAVKDIKNPSLARLLTRAYLGGIAAGRSALTYPPDGELENRDWDGTSLFDSVSLPDSQTAEDISDYNRAVVIELKAIDDSTLDEFERTLKQEVLFDARARAVHIYTSCGAISSDYDVVEGYQGDRGRPRIFASDDEVLGEVNALYLNNTPLQWLDVGTMASTVHRLCKGNDEELHEYVGKPCNKRHRQGNRPIKELVD